ncbi:MAG: type II toxin-antitoxin system RelE/ParE family toxin [Candidatus Micrarchaeota archaeon]
MAFKLIYSEDTIIQLRKLDNPTARRIVEKPETTITNPNHFFERLVGRDEYKTRIGDYRIIARIDQNLQTINIVSLGHRKNIYKNSI